MLAKELDRGRHAAFFHERQLATPCLTIDLQVIEARYRELRAALPRATIHYAIKAQPHPEVVAVLAALGSSFDVASAPELDLCLSLGVPPGRISYGNTVKAEKDIAYAYRRGVGLFAFDSECELVKLGRAAPGARVFCRVLVSSEGAQWPLSGKFGCAPDMAVGLLAAAPALGLEPCGVSFHTGSQQLDPGAWQAGCDLVAAVFRRLRPRVRLSLVNLGGGLPARYDDSVPALDEYAKAIEAAVAPLGADTVIAEPGRFIAGDAGVFRSQVITVARKSRRARVRWVYVDAGRFHGLAEAGRTCDSFDVIYKRRPLYLPVGLEPGHYIDFLAAGAYTTPYASAFNGFPPPATHCFGGST